MTPTATQSLYEIEQAFMDAMDAYEAAIEREDELAKTEAADDNAFMLAAAKQDAAADVDAALNALAVVFHSEVKKVDNIASYDRWCEQMLDGCRSVRDQASERMRVWANRRERVRLATLLALQNSGKNKLESALHRISRQMGPPSVEFTGEEIPEQFVRVKTIREADKKAIQQAILRGEAVPGARLVRSEHVRIS